MKKLSYLLTALAILSFALGTFSCGGGGGEQATGGGTTTPTPTTQSQTPGGTESTPAQPTTTESPAPEGNQNTTAQPTSADLIEQAQDSGAIDADTALIYRVYAAFGDPTLPVQYRGDDTVSYLSDDLIMYQVAEEWSGLSPQAQATLRPFFIPPAYPGSWTDKFDKPAKTASSGDRVLTLLPLSQQASQSANYPELSLCSIGNPVISHEPAYGSNPLNAPAPVPKELPKEGWNTDSTNPYVKVWWQDTNPDALNQDKTIQNAITFICTRLQSLMGLPPVSDVNITAENGGDGKLDIYIYQTPSMQENPKVLGGNTPFSPDEWAQAPTYIVLNPKAVVLSVLVHEVMHAFQSAYAYAYDFNNYLWWWESTADWAIDYVYPTGIGNPEHNRLPLFFESASKSLDDTADERLPYSRYVFPFFLWHKYGGHKYGASGQNNIIQDIFINDAQSDSLTAIDTTLKQDGGLEKVWPEFARYNWNRPPLQDYKDWDSILGGMKTEKLTFDSSGRDSQYDSIYNYINLGGQPEKRYEIVDYTDKAVKHLSAKYYHFKFNDVNARSVVFLNGFSYKMSLQPAGDPGGQGYGWDCGAVVMPHTVPGASVQALVKIQGGNWEWQDWTDRPCVFFARDTKVERIEELVLVFANSNTQSDIAPGDLPPTILASNIGSWRYTGTYTYQESGSLPYGDGSVNIMEDLIYERKPLMGDWSVMSPDNLNDIASALNAALDIFSGHIAFVLKKQEMTWAEQYPAKPDDCWQEFAEMRKNPERIDPGGILVIGYPIYSGPASRAYYIENYWDNYQVVHYCQCYSSEDCKWCLCTPKGEKKWRGCDYDVLFGLSFVEQQNTLNADGSIVLADQFSTEDSAGSVTLTLTPQRE